MFHNLFPYVTFTDSYDSLNPKTSSDNLIVPVKNLMNDAYCRDISIKIRSQLDIKRKKGDFIAPFAVYGYLKDSENKNKLIVDEFAAAVVQDIFKFKLDGMSAQAIADRLNEQDILSPLEYKNLIGLKYKTTFKANPKAKWTAAAILRILKNPIYVGTLVQGKRSSPNYKVKKRFDKPADQWISIENNHEPIIDNEAFNNVAKILRSDTRTAPSEETVYPLAGLIYCGDCGKSMVRKNNASSKKPYIYYVCSGCKSGSGCTSHSIRDILLEKAVLVALQEHIRAILDVAQTLDDIKNLPYTSRQVKKADERLAAKRKELAKYQNNKMKLHEDYICPAHTADPSRCSFLSIKETDLINIVFEYLQSQFTVALDIEKQLRNIEYRTSVMSEEERVARQIEQAKQQIIRIQRLRECLYDDYLDHLMNERDYLYSQNRYKEKESALNEQLAELLSEQKHIRETKTEENPQVKALLNFCDDPKLTKNMVSELIDKIVVQDSSHAKVWLRYRDEYEQLQSCLPSLEVAANE